MVVWQFDSIERALKPSLAATALIFATSLFVAVHSRASGVVDLPPAMSLEQVMRTYPNATVGVEREPNLPTGPQDRSLDDPDVVEKEMRERPVQNRAYYVSCARVLEPVFDRPLLAPDLEAEKAPFQFGGNPSLQVGAFMTIDGIQFIYGTFVNQRGFTTGAPYYVPAFDWDCRLYKNWK